MHRRGPASRIPEAVVPAGGPDEVATPKRKATLSRSDVLDAAHAIARRRGFDGVTIRALCDELGVTAPTIYWHIGAKASLVDALVDDVLARLEVPPEPSTWVEGMREVGIQFRDLVFPYSGLAHHVARSEPSAVGLAHARAVLTMLRCAGLSTEDAVQVFSVVSMFVTGHLLQAEALLHQAAVVAADRPARRTTAAMARQRKATIDKSVTLAFPDDLSSLADFLSGFDGAAARQQFVWGLDRLLDGLAAEVGREPRRTSGS